MKKGLFVFVLFILNQAFASEPQILLKNTADHFQNNKYVYAWGYSISNDLNFFRYDPSSKAKTDFKCKNETIHQVSDVVISSDDNTAIFRDPSIYQYQGNLTQIRIENLQTQACTKLNITAKSDDNIFYQFISPTVVLVDIQTGNSMRTVKLDLSSQTQKEIFPPYSPNTAWSKKDFAYHLVDNDESSILVYGFHSDSVSKLSWPGFSVVFAGAGEVSESDARVLLNNNSDKGLWMAAFDPQKGIVTSAPKKIIESPIESRLRFFKNYDFASYVVGCDGSDICENDVLDTRTGQFTAIPGAEFETATVKGQESLIHWNYDRVNKTQTLQSMDLNSKKISRYNTYMSDVTSTAISSDKLQVVFTMFNKQNNKYEARIASTSDLAKDTLLFSSDFQMGNPQFVDGDHAVVFTSQDEWAHGLNYDLYTFDLQTK